MLVPSDMIVAQSKMVYQMNKYCSERVQVRKATIHKTIQEVCRIVQDVLKEVEVQEPRFISSLNDYNGRFEGLEVISPSEFEIVIYLNQMGVLNFVDDGTLPGCAVLKLSDGRKRSMSLWVEFITASGYLSARKIRSRFQTLVAQACDKCAYRDIVKMIADTTEVKLRIRERIIVQITPAFKCAGLWPRSATHWPLPGIPWPHPNIVAEVKTEGFDMLSKECIALQGKNSAMEGDAWVLSFIDAENRLLQGSYCHKKYIQNTYYISKYETQSINYRLFKLLPCQIDNKSYCIKSNFFVSRLLSTVFGEWNVFGSAFSERFVHSLVKRQNSRYKLKRNNRDKFLPKRFLHISAIFTVP